MTNNPRPCKDAYKLTDLLCRWIENKRPQSLLNEIRENEAKASPEERMAACNIIIGGYA